MKFKKFATVALVAPMVLFSLGYKTEAEEISTTEKYAEQIEQIKDNPTAKQRGIQIGDDFGIEDGWMYGIQGDVAELISYVGSSKTDIKIPAEVGGKPTMINWNEITEILSLTGINPDGVKSITFVEENGKKVIPGYIGVNYSTQQYTFDYEKALKVDMFKNLEKFDGRGLDTSHMTSFRHAFAYNKQLKSINLDNIDTSNVKDMAYTFDSCTSLTDISLKNWDTRNVTEMQQMFFNCPLLETLDISSFSTPKLNKMEFMFARNGASVYRLDNFSTSAVYDLNKFGLFDNTPQGKELLVTTKDQKLLNYNYSNRKAFATPKLNANGGKFANGQSTKSYFERCAVTPDKLDLTAFEQFKNSNKPTKAGAQFVGWTDSNDASPSTVLDLLNKEFKAIWK